MMQRMTYMDDKTHTMTLVQSRGVKCLVFLISDLLLQISCLYINTESRKRSAKYNPKENSVFI